MALRDLARAILESYRAPESAVERLKFDKLMKELSAELVSDEPDKHHEKESQHGTEAKRGDGQGKTRHSQQETDSR